jgi:hypothetical protein
MRPYFWHKAKIAVLTSVFSNTALNPLNRKRQKVCTYFWHKSNFTIFDLRFPYRNFEEHKNCEY